MALIIMGSSGGCCGRSGSALPDITMHAGAGARGASRVSATNMRGAPDGRRRRRTRTPTVWGEIAGENSRGVRGVCTGLRSVGVFDHLLSQSSTFAIIYFPHSTETAARSPPAPRARR